MYRLSPEEFRDRVEPNLLKIFSREDLQTCFNPLVPERIFLYGHFFQIEEKLLDTIITSAIDCGEPDCYFLCLTGDMDCFYIPLVDLKYAYYEPTSSDTLPDFDEHIIFSCKGTWGVMIDTESIGLLGGSIEFMNNVRKICPEVDYEVYSFLGSELVCHYHNYLWFKPILSNVYGSEKTDAMIKTVENIINTAKSDHTIEIILRILWIRFGKAPVNIKTTLSHVRFDFNLIQLNEFSDKALLIPTLDDFQRYLDSIKEVLGILGARFRDIPINIKSSLSHVDFNYNFNELYDKALVIPTVDDFQEYLDNIVKR